MWTPHDDFCGTVFARLEHARALLVAVLSKELVAAIDWNTLELLTGSFLDERAHTQHVDLLFSPSWRCARTAAVARRALHSRTRRPRPVASPPGLFASRLSASRFAALVDAWSPRSSSLAPGVRGAGRWCARPIA